MAKSLFEELGGRYERQGDYLIPCLSVPAEEEQPIGIWGQRHMNYLKQYHKVTYTNLGHETGTGHNGTAKGRKRLRMGREDEQHTGLCNGDCKRGNNLRITDRRQRVKALSLCIC